MILRDFYFIYKGLTEIQSLYNNGIRGNDKNIYLKLDSIANCANELDQRYRSKLNTDTNFYDLLNFSGLSISIIKLERSIEYPDDYHPYWNNAISPFYEDKVAKKNLENLFNEVDKFIEKKLDTIIQNLKSLLNNHTFIDLDKYDITINEEDVNELKNHIRYKINNEYDALTYKTLELYYYSPSEIVNAASHRAHWHLKLKSSLSDLNTKTIPYGDYLIENLTINKLVELASDFNIQIPKISLLPK